MTNVVHLPGFTSVEIWSGTVQTATITDEHGTRTDLSDVGKHLFFVDVIEDDGTRICMWTGADKLAASREANILSKDFGGKVVDKTEVPA